MRILRLMPLIGIALLLYILLRIGVKSVVNAFLNANYFYIVLMLCTFLPLLLLQTYKWGYLLKKQKINLGFAYLLKLQVISLFYELVTPARIGSLIKIAYLKEKTKNFGKSASSVVIDRALDFLVVAFLAFLGSLSLASREFNLFYACIIIFIVFLAGFAVLMNKCLMKLFAAVFYGIFLPRRFKKNAKKSFNEFYKNMPPAKSIAFVFFLTLVFWVFVYTQAYLSALAFNVEISYPKFLVIFPISVIISLLPITVSGFGTREAVLLNLLKGYGEKQNIVAFSMLWAAFSLVVYSALGLFFLFKKDKKKRKK